MTPDDTVYAAAWLEGQQTRMQISALGSGTRRFTPVGEEGSFSFSGDPLSPAGALFFELGDVYPTGTPAVYVHTIPSAQSLATQPLYRLALPSGETHPQPVVTPLLTPTTSATSTPAPHPACTSAPGDVGNIQNGGYGANIDTFAQRWGASVGVAAGSELIGQWSDGTPKVQVADALPSNQRIYQMSYHVDKAQEVSQAQGEVLAKSILPKDATPTGHSQQDNELIVTHCSAAFPPSVQDINGPLPHNGLIVVRYALRTDGNIEGISFTPMLY